MEKATKDSLIAEQQLEIKSQKDTIKAMLGSFRDIKLSLYACGAPLNDNLLLFNEEQRAYLHRIDDNLWDIYEVKDALYSTEWLSDFE